MLYQQTTKDIFKRLTKILKGKEVTGVFSYLNDFLTFVQEPPKIKFTKSIPTLISIIKASLLHQIMLTGNLLRKDNNLSFDEKWNKAYLTDIIRTARLNAVYFTAKTFYEQIDEHKLSEGLYNTMSRLCQIFCCQMILKYCEIAILNDVIDADDLFEINNWMQEMVDDSTSQLLDLVEPTISSERTVGSPLSPTTGNPYEQLYSHPSKNPFFF